MPQGELSIQELVAHCDALLDIHATRDFGPNGLQVEGRRAVRKIVTGVSACLELFERAREANADAILVHHGLFWDGSPRQITGVAYRRIAALIEAGIHLAAYHLPLDRHAELGNNILAARGLGLYSIEPFAWYEGATIGFRGRYPEPLAAEDFFLRCAALFGQTPIAFAGGPDAISSVGVVSGGAQRDVHQAIAGGLDAYVTGEPAEWAMHLAREAGIHYVAAGHHATERLGIRALGDHLAQRFGIEHEFVDLPNPI